MLDGISCGFFGILPIMEDNRIFFWDLNGILKALSMDFTMTNCDNYEWEYDLGRIGIGIGNHQRMRIGKHVDLHKESIGYNQNEKGVVLGGTGIQ